MTVQTAADYVAAATAIAEGPAPEVPAAVETLIPAGANSSEPVEVSTVAETPGEEKPLEADKIEAPPPADKKPASRIEKGYEDLAREKAAFRKEREAAGAERALSEAAKRGDAMALLAAAGIPWSKAAQQVLDGTGKRSAPEVEEPDPRDQRLAALEQEIATTKASAMRQQLMGNLKELTKDARFKHVAGMEAEGQVIGYIERYFNETGELPGSNLQETMEIAAEAVETQLAKEAARWSKVLTGFKGGATVPSSKSVVPAAGASSQVASKTLTNNVGSGPAPASAAPKKPKTDEEYQRAALEALTAS